MVAKDPLIVDFARRDSVLRLYPEAPLLSSDQAGWEGIQLHYHRQPTYEMAEQGEIQPKAVLDDLAGVTVAMVSAAHPLTVSQE